MKKNILVVLLVVAIVVGYFALNMHKTAEACPTDNVSPMYGCMNYEEYVSKRNLGQKEADDKLTQSVLELYKNDSVAASNSANKKGWDLLKSGDLETARRRFNQAWLLDHSNYVVFWQFAISYAQENKNAIALENFEKAVSMYDKKYDTGKDDHMTLICDRGLSYLTNAAAESDTAKQKQLLDKVISILETEIKNNQTVSGQCLLTESQAYAAMGDKEKAKAKINDAIKIEPELKGSPILEAIRKDFGL